MLNRYYGDVATVIVEPGTKTGVPVLTDNPKEVAPTASSTRSLRTTTSADRIVVDFGTSTNLDVVSAKGSSSAVHSRPASRSRSTPWPSGPPSSRR